MNKIMRWEEYIKEDINPKKLLMGGALVGGLLSSEPSISQDKNKDNSEYTFITKPKNINNLTNNLENQKLENVPIYGYPGLNLMLTDNLQKIEAKFYSINFTRYYDNKENYDIIKFVSPDKKIEVYIWYQAPDSYKTFYIYTKDQDIALNYRYLLASKFSGKDYIFGHHSWGLQGKGSDIIKSYRTEDGKYEIDCSNRPLHYVTENLENCWINLNWRPDLNSPINSEYLICFSNDTPLNKEKFQESFLEFQEKIKKRVKIETLYKWNYPYKQEIGKYIKMVFELKLSGKSEIIIVAFVGTTEEDLFNQEDLFTDRFTRNVKPADYLDLYGDFEKIFPKLFEMARTTSKNPLSYKLSSRGYVDVDLMDGKIWRFTLYADAKDSDGTPRKIRTIITENHTGFVRPNIEHIYDKKIPKVIIREE
jgi:hypothetical protein